MKCEVWTTNRLGLIAAETLHHLGAEVRLRIWSKEGTTDSPREYTNAMRQFDVELSSRKITQPFEGADLDFVLVCGWPRLVDPEMPYTRAVIGFHPSPLPIGRGRAPIPHTILTSLEMSAATLFRITKGVDTGVILAQSFFDVPPDATGWDVYWRVETHLRLAIGNWDEADYPMVTGIPQHDNLATAWPQRTPADSQICANMTVDEAHRLVRAMDGPYPSAFLGGFDFDNAGVIERGDFVFGLRGNRLHMRDGRFSINSELRIGEVP